MIAFINEFKPQNLLIFVMNSTSMFQVEKIEVASLRAKYTSAMVIIFVSHFSEIVLQTFEADIDTSIPYCSVVNSHLSSFPSIHILEVLFPCYWWEQLRPLRSVSNI